MRYQCVYMLLNHSKKGRRETGGGWRERAAGAGGRRLFRWIIKILIYLWTIDTILGTLCRYGHFFSSLDHRSYLFHYILSGYFFNLFNFYYYFLFHYMRKVSQVHLSFSVASCETNIPKMFLGITALYETLMNQESIHKKMCFKLWE